MADIRARVAAALVGANRTDEVMVVAVGKRHGADALRAAFESGLRHFGENYVQEAVEKMGSLHDLGIVWHFVGRIQANKARLIAEKFDWVHTVDRAKLVNRLDEHRPRHAPPLNVLIQVNQGGERQKAGVAPGDVEPLARTIAAAPALALRGLMSLPPQSDANASRTFYREIRVLGDRLRARGLPVDVLSMGMSGDFEAAIAEGSNCVRLGTAIFGPRTG